MWYILKDFWLWMWVCKQQCYFDRNKLPCLPSWASECFFMVKLDASHNVITGLPPRLVGVVPLKVWLFYCSMKVFLLLKFGFKVFVLSATKIKSFLKIIKCFGRFILKSKELLIYVYIAADVFDKKISCCKVYLFIIFESFQGTGELVAVFVGVFLRLFCDARKLKVLNLSHNKISEVPSDLQNCVLEDLHLEHNCLTLLPGHLMLQASKWVSHSNPLKKDNFIS